MMETKMNKLRDSLGRSRVFPRVERSAIGRCVTLRELLENLLLNRPKR